MISNWQFLGCATAVAAALSFAGCNAQSGGEAPGEAAHDEHAAHGDDHGGEGHAGHGHAHPEHGPHDGDLIELGDGEYHGELVHDADSVTIYILDAAAKAAVAIDATEVTINLKHDGQPEQFILTASPQEGDAEGKSSRFTVDDGDLAGHLDAEDAGAKLMVTIDGTSFNGAIADHHDHAGHEH